MINRLFIRKSLLIILIALILLSCNLLALGKNIEPSPTAAQEEASPTAQDAPTLPPSPTAVPQGTAASQPTSTIPPQPTLAPTPELPTAGPFRASVVVSDLLPGGVVDMESFPETGVWLLTTGGAARYDGETWQVQFTDIGDRVMVGVDALARVWALSADYSQMIYWQNGAWSSPTEGWVTVDDPYFPIWQKLQMDSSGSLWYATTQDVRRYDGERWQILSPQEMLMPPLMAEDIIHTFTISPFPFSEEVWVGQCDWSGPGPFSGMGARWWDGQNWLGATSPVTLGCVNRISPDFVGNLVWLGNDSVVWRFDRESSKWEAASSPPKPNADLRLGAILDIAIGLDGSVWTTYLACGGASCSQVVVYVLQNGEWQLLGLDGKEIYNAQVVFDQDWKAWVFTSGAGLCEVNDGKLVTIAEIEASSITRELTGGIWFTGALAREPEMVWQSSGVAP